MIWQWYRSNCNPRRSGPPTAAITAAASSVVLRKKPGMSRWLMGSITGFTPAFAHSSAAQARFTA